MEEITPQRRRERGDQRRFGPPALFLLWRKNLLLLRSIGVILHEVHDGDVGVAGLPVSTMTVSEMGVPAESRMCRVKVAGRGATPT